LALFLSFLDPPPTSIFTLSLHDALPISSALSLLGGGCRLNSDCEGGLICAYGVCREECRTSEDCEGGRCVLDARKVHFCQPAQADRKSTRLNSSHVKISYAVFCLKKKTQ